MRNRLARYTSKHMGPGSKGIALCTTALILCVLVSAAPLKRLAGTTELLALPSNNLLLAFGNWLPVNFAWASSRYMSQRSTHLALFLASIALISVIYGLSLWWLQRQPADRDNRHILRLIWLGTLLAGLIYVLTPAMLSRDPYVYAGYGRLLTVHQVNPYFTPLSAYPADPFYPLDDWHGAVAAYGPVWLLICTLGALFAGDNPLQYVLFYRLLGLVTHLLNALLVAAILRSTGRSPRTIATGTLLYAWNPLVLQESCLGGHNDTFMLTLILLGTLNIVRVKYRATAPLTAVRSYLPPLVAFTLAALIKFIALPIVALFLVLLAREALVPGNIPVSFLSLKEFRTWRWRDALMTVIPAAFISASIAILGYAPFWIGHSFASIAASFTSPPSASQAFGSILSALLNWEKLYGLPSPQNWAYPLLILFSSHQFWQNISTVVLAILMITGAIWLCYVPTVRTLALANVAILGGLLIVTPWFFPWYVTWLVGLAAISLPANRDRSGRALVALTLAFSISAYAIYYFRGYAPLGDWIGLTFLSTIGPPILALLLFMLLPIKGKHETEQQTSILSE